MDYLPDQVPGSPLGAALGGGGGSSNNSGNTSSDAWLSMIIRKEMAEINMLLPETQPSDCLLTQMGEYLCRATSVIAQLAQRITHGNHIDTYAQLNVNQMDRQTGLSELGRIDIMTAKHTTLKTIAEMLEQSSRDIIQAWRQCNPSSSYSDLSRPDTVSTLARSSVTIPSFDPWPSEGMNVPTSQQSALSVAADAEGGDGHEPPLSVPSIDDVAADLLEQMKYRGKGTYYCPYGQDCVKGGVAPDGTQIAFTRNSSFKAHLEKHLKQYKCTLPGCPNKTGFARLDLLERHQAGTAHGRPVP